MSYCWKVFMFDHDSYSGLGLCNNFNFLMGDCFANKQRARSIVRELLLAMTVKLKKFPSKSKASTAARL